MRSVFDSKRIMFTNICEDLVTDYLNMVNDIEGVAQYIADRKTPYSLEEELEFIRSKLKEKAHIFSMFQKSTGEFIGNIELQNVTAQCGELGIALTASKQELGYGTEAINRMFIYGFSQLGLQRIYLTAFASNLRAIHVYKKCGFVTYHVDDKSVFMEITAKDWLGHSERDSK